MDKNDYWLYLCFNSLVEVFRKFAKRTKVTLIDTFFSHFYLNKGINKRRVACSVGKDFLFYTKLLTLLHTFIEIISTTTNIRLLVYCLYLIIFNSIILTCEDSMFPKSLEWIKINAKVNSSSDTRHKKPLFEPH